MTRAILIRVALVVVLVAALAVLIADTWGR